MRFRVPMCVLLILSMVFPSVTSASGTKNYFDSIPVIGVNFEGKLSTLSIQEEDLDFTSGEVFRVILPEGVSWRWGSTLPSDSGYPSNTGNLNGYRPSGSSGGGGGGGIQAQLITNLENVASYTINGSVMEIKVSDVQPTGKIAIQVPLFVNVSNVTVGSLKLQIEPLDSVVTAGTYVFARVSETKTILYVRESPTIGVLGILPYIRLEEGYQFSLGPSPKVIFTIPDDFVWGNVTAGMIPTIDLPTVEIKGNELILTFNDKSVRSFRTYIFLSNSTIIKVRNMDKASDVTLTVSGDQVTPESKLVAKYHPPIDLFSIVKGVKISDPNWQHYIENYGYQ